MNSEDVPIIAAKTAYAIKCLNDENIVHLDLKLNNIMFNPQTKVLKLIDFGHSRNISGINEQLYEKPGNLKYYSPEIVCSSDSCYNYNYQYDWYSFGVVLYQLLAGKIIVEPFREHRHCILNECKKEGMSIVEFCTEDVENRVACLNDIKFDLFFDSINWDKIENTHKRRILYQKLIE